MGTHQKHLCKVVLISTNDICFCGEIRKISVFLAAPYLELCIQSYQESLALKRMQRLICIL